MGKGLLLCYVVSITLEGGHFACLPGLSYLCEGTTGDGRNEGNGRDCSCSNGCYALLPEVLGARNEGTKAVSLSRCALLFCV